MNQLLTYWKLMASCLLLQWFIFSIMFYSFSPGGLYSSPIPILKVKYIFSSLKVSILVELDYSKWKRAQVGMWGRQSSIWELGFVYYRTCFILFEWELDLKLYKLFNVLSALHCCRLTKTAIECFSFLSEGPRFPWPKVRRARSLQLAMEMEILNRQELFKSTMKLKRMLKATMEKW